MNRVELKLRSIEDTRIAAENLSAKLVDGDIVMLNGELGAGKTFFVKSICEFWGIKNAGSPSFSIVNQYSGRRKVYHFDFYRINKIEELFDIGIEEYFADKSAITFIEWADRFTQIIPNHHYRVDLSFINLSERKMVIEKRENK